MTKSPDAFRTISEVADWLGIQAHVLRFWESKFRQVKPVKRAGGRRYYRPADMQLIGGIKKLLHDDGMTIKGVQKILKEQGVEHVAAQSQPLDDIAAPGAAPAPEPADAGAKVLHFRGKASAAPDSNDMPEEDDLTDAPDIDAEPEFDLEPEISAEVEAEPEPESEPVPEPAPEPRPDAAAAQDPNPPLAKPALPSFLQRPPAAAPAEPPRAEARARMIDMPEPAAESELPYAEGLLARLARIERLTPDQARQIAPLAEDLRGWLESRRNAHSA